MARTGIEITIDASTLTELRQDGFQLYVFRQVSSSNRSGTPLVAGRLGTGDYLGRIPVVVDDGGLSAFVSLDAIAADEAVAIGTSASVSIGETAKAGDGDLTVVAGGIASAVTLVGATGRRFVCGLAADPEIGTSTTGAVPFCAFQLPPGTQVVVEPKQAVFLMWATSTYDTGVVMTASLGPGVLVALDPAATRALSYDIDAGWQWPAGALWPKAVPLGTALAGLLVLDPGHNHALT